MRDLPPVHPGEILLEEFFSPLCIYQYRLARDINVPAVRISQICRKESGNASHTRRVRVKHNINR